MSPNSTYLIIMRFKSSPKVSPVDSHTHHAPQTAKTTHAADDCCELAEGVVLFEGVRPIHAPIQHVQEHHHHSQVKHG